MENANILSKFSESESWFLLMVADRVSKDGALLTENGKLIDVQDLSVLLCKSDANINRILRQLKNKNVVKRVKIPQSKENKRAILINREILEKIKNEKNKQY